MRLALERYRQVTRTSQILGWSMLVGGAVAVTWGLFFVFVGVLMVGTGTAEEQSAGVLAALVFGLAPLLAGGGLLTAGAVFAGRTRRYRELGLAIRRLDAPTARSVCAELPMGQRAAERLLFDALARGVVVEGELAPPPSAAPSTAPSLVAAAPYSPQPAAPLLPPVVAAPPYRAPGEVAPDEPRPSLAGVVVGGTYAVEGEIASGGVARVYSARHLRTGRRYAIKTLLPDARTSREMVARFQREAAAASALGHPGIIGVHDFDVTPEGVHYIVMDLLEGETLEARIGRRGALPWAEAHRLTSEVGAALSAAHEAGIIHRDLTPANVFLASDEARGERAVLLDFGLAKPLEAAGPPLTRTGAVLGTPLYMSPEQARGEPADVRSDVYALATVLYEMVTAMPPFVEPTLGAVYARLLGSPPVAASRVAPAPLPPGLDAVLDRALAKLPERRYPSVRAFLAALDLDAVNGAGATGLT